MGSTPQVPSREIVAARLNKYRMFNSFAVKYRILERSIKSNGAGVFCSLITKAITLLYMIIILPVVETMCI